MISRNRSAPTIAAMSIECTTSAKSTVTCLYSADRLTSVTGAPHSLQNLEFGGSSVPHDPHGSPAAISAPLPSPLGSTSVSFHCWSTMSVISPCHLRHEILTPSYVDSFEVFQNMSLRRRPWLHNRCLPRIRERATRILAAEQPQPTLVRIECHRMLDTRGRSNFLQLLPFAASPLPGVSVHRSVDCGPAVQKQ